MLAEPMNKPNRKVCVGVIAGPHGVDGRVRVKSFTAERDGVAAYGPVTDASGAREFTLEPAGSVRGMFLARIAGIQDRNAAEALRGVELYVERDRLPPPEEDEFYHADLLGLAVKDKTGAVIGAVRTVQNYGAGDMIEIEWEDGRVDLLPFTMATAPTIDLDEGFVVIDPPNEIYVRPDSPDATDKEPDV